MIKYETVVINLEESNIARNPILLWLEVYRSLKANNISKEELNEFITGASKHAKYPELETYCKTWVSLH